MSFIPGEQSDIAAVASNIGSGISVSTVGDVDYVATNLVAGAGIALTPSVTDTSITISSTGGGGGISAVSSGAGSGITATTVGTAVSLTSALVAGTGISLAPGVGNNLTINNTQTLSAATGSGIALTPSGANTAIAANLVGGTGIAITPSGLNSSKTIANTGVTSLAAGANITLSGSTGAVTISAAGGGTTITTPNGAGVLAVPSGNNYTLTSSLVAGSGITLTPAPNSTQITISATGGGAPTTQNVTEVHQWTNTNQNVDGGGTYNIEISVPLNSPNNWSSTFATALVQFSITLTQTLTTSTSVSPVVETLTFQSGTVVSPTLNNPIVPYQITNNVGITTNGQTYTNTYTGSFIIGGANVVVPGYVYSIFMNATNNINDGLSYTTYAVQNGWVTITPMV